RSRAGRRRRRRGSPPGPLPVACGCTRSRCTRACGRRDLEGAARARQSRGSDRRRRADRHSATRTGCHGCRAVGARCDGRTSAFAERRLVAISVALLLGGWWWGSVRLDALDRSPLAARIGTAERLRVVVTSTPRPGRFDIRAQGKVTRFGTLRPDESVLLRLRPGRAPPQGAILEALGVLAAPRTSDHGYD